MNSRQRLTLPLVLAALLATPLHAQPARPDNPPAYGPGMMGGYGPGMMGSDGRGGMMGGYGAGPGQGYGPGMMGGGMMGPYGRDGMMGLGPLQALDLDEQQIGRMNQIRDELRRKNWAAMGKLQDERAQMRDLFLADKRDPAAIGRQSMKIAELRRQLLEARIDAHNRIEALLSKEQKAQLRSYRRGWMMNDED
ncbi:MAG: Spy/CpxP family protein refolding chaperone [Curvibacter sp.]